MLILFLLWFAGFALGMLVLWMMIRSAVRRALRDHYLRLQENQTAHTDYAPAGITPPQP